MVTLFPSSTFLLSDPPSPLVPLPFVCNNTSQRTTREISHTLSKFLNNLIYTSTARLSFETYPEDIYTIPLIREHHDSYFYYIDTHSLVASPEEPPFSIPFTSPINHSDTFRKNIHYIFIFPLRMYLPPFLKTSKKNIIFYLNMFLIHPQSKPFFRRNLFLISLILKNSAILKTTLTTGLLLIFSKFIIFNTNFFKISLSIQVLKNKSRYTFFSWKIL